MSKTIRIPVARVGEIPVGGVKYVRYGIHQALVYNDGGALKAYVNRCTHMGGPTELARDGVLRCRWHEATFNPQTGMRLSGQAPEGTSLQMISLQTENDEVFALYEIRDEFEF